MVSPLRTQITLRKIMNPQNIHRVVPIISDSFYINAILGNEDKLKGATAEQQAGDQDLSPDERLTRLWSAPAEVNYPLEDGHNLARVAQFYQVQQELPVAKGNYLRFRKRKLLEINPEKRKRLPQLNTETSFSEIVSQLYSAGLGDRDPLDKLANVQFLNYITTSYYDFMERALLKASRTPITQYLCLDELGKLITTTILPYRDESGNLVTPPADQQGTATHPMVYHLFGFEHNNNAESFVLSEDDHIKFLIAAVTGLSIPQTNSDVQRDARRTGLPTGLRTILSTQNLLLLGYQLENWDFRVLFRLLLELRTSQQKSSIFLQIPPHKKVDNLLEYVIEYFRPNQFDVEETDPLDFIGELWKIYDQQQPKD